MGSSDEGLCGDATFRMPPLVAWANASSDQKNGTLAAAWST
jgi:hypothetical protein